MKKRTFPYTGRILRVLQKINPDTADEVDFFSGCGFYHKTHFSILINQPKNLLRRGGRADGVWLFSKGVGLGFHTSMTAAKPRGMKPSPRINNLALQSGVLNHFDTNKCIYNNRIPYMPENVKCLSALLPRVYPPAGAIPRGGGTVLRAYPGASPQAGVGVFA
jgi:hypothetical protein